MPDKMPWDMPDRMPEAMPDRMLEDMPDRMPDDVPDKMSEDMPEHMPEDIPDRMPDRMPEDMSEYMPEDMPDRMPEDMSDRMPEDMPEHMPEDMPDRMPEDMSDRMPEDLPVRKCIKVMVGITRSKVINVFVEGGLSYSILVGALEHEFCFLYLGNFVIPTDFHIFQRGRSTTNQHIVGQSCPSFLGRTVLDCSGLFGSQTWPWETTLWLFNIAMGNGQFIDGLPIKKWWFSMAMLVITRWYQFHFWNS